MKSASVLFFGFLAPPPDSRSEGRLLLSGSTPFLRANELPDRESLQNSQNQAKARSHLCLSASSHSMRAVHIYGREPFEKIS
jgi:hypothetical protein